ncbi:MAG: DUF502 domain-containing protein [Dehalococcoidales bacterium]|nr:DUF502 domain-containing protein [Dehalococcoidales bacterium]
MPRRTIIKTLNECGSSIKGFCYRSPRHVITYLMHGLIIIVPLAVTLWVLIWIFNIIDGMLAPILRWAFGRPMPGLGFAIIVVSVILIGYLGIKIGKKKAFDFIESNVIRIPIVGSIYGGTRQIITSFTTSTNSKFLEVVFIEFPRKGIYTVGLVTSEVSDRSGKKVLNVFVPTTPNPTSGYLQIVPESDIIRSTMSVNDAMKLIISAGKVYNKDIANMLLQVPESESKGTVLEI